MHSKNVHLIGWNSSYRIKRPTYIWLSLKYPNSAYIWEIWQKTLKRRSLKNFKQQTVPCIFSPHGRWSAVCSSVLVPQIDPSVPQPVVQSWRRPLLGPSPGWKRLLALSHLRYYAKRTLTHLVSRPEIGTVFGAFYQEKALVGAFFVIGKSSRTFG